MRLLSFCCTPKKQFLSQGWSWNNSSVVLKQAFQQRFTPLGPVIVMSCILDAPPDKILRVRLQEIVAWRFIYTVSHAYLEIIAASTPPADR